MSALVTPVQPPAGSASQASSAARVEGQPISGIEEGLAAVPRSSAGSPPG